MTISDKAWSRYIAALRKVSKKAASEMEIFAATNPTRRQLTDKAVELVAKYGEATAALAAEYCNKIALASGILADSQAAMDFSTRDISRSLVVNLKHSGTPEMAGDVVGRLVKMAGVDTVAKNAIRQNAEWAWIPSGETCAFCLALASQGWQLASARSLRGGHMMHIHPNCDCTYAIRYNDKTNVAGYDPAKYKAVYDSADGHGSASKINYIRRENYRENREHILAEQRAAYARREEEKEQEGEK